MVHTWGQMGQVTAVDIEIAQSDQRVGLRLAWGRHSPRKLDVSKTLPLTWTISKDLGDIGGDRRDPCEMRDRVKRKDVHVHHGTS